MTDPFCKIALVTVLSLGVPIFTVLPITTAWYVLPVAGAADSLTVLPANAKPSEGVDEPALGFCTTPFILSKICCESVGALVKVKSCVVPSKAGLSVDIKKLPILCASSQALLVPLYTSSLPVLVLKNKSPLSSELVGFDDPTLYLSEKSFISPLRLIRSSSLSVAL